MSAYPERLVTIPLDGVDLNGDLVVPNGATGVVVFAHGSGSSRKSPRNTYVADVLQTYNLGTLLFDLLTEREDMAYERRFDIDLLTTQLLGAIDWLRQRRATQVLPAGYFGSSIGAAAALRAAAQLQDVIGAVVSCGGRVDLATESLSRVTAATLFIVGGADTQVLRLN